MGIFKEITRFTSINQKRQNLTSFIIKMAIVPREKKISVAYFNVYSRRCWVYIKNTNKCWVSKIPMLSKQTSFEIYVEIIISIPKITLREQAQCVCYPSTEWPQMLILMLESIYRHLAFWTQILMLPMFFWTSPKLTKQT